MLMEFLGKRLHPSRVRRRLTDSKHIALGSAPRTLLWVRFLHGQRAHISYDYGHADTLSPDTNALIPTVTDNAFSQGSIGTKEVGISFAPTTSLSDPNGELTLGGIDTDKFTGPLQFV